jgi:hypothetical protein
VCRGCRREPPGAGGGLRQKLLDVDRLGKERSWRLKELDKLGQGSFPLGRDSLGMCKDSFFIYGCQKWKISILIQFFAIFY